MALYKPKQLITSLEKYFLNAPAPSSSTTADSSLSSSNLTNDSLSQQLSPISGSSSSVCNSPTPNFLSTLRTPPIRRRSQMAGLRCLSEDNRENRRGRPRSEDLSTLMREGSTSPSSIKCIHCNRVFPREKSLQAHLRIHTGERPYICDFPGCSRAFTQSGQLNTHKRLHTGEHPFKCSAHGCKMKFVHANRHCREHPTYQLKRCDDFILETANSEQNTEVLKWIKKNQMDREDRTPTRKPLKRHTAAMHDDQNNENINIDLNEMQKYNTSDQQLYQQQLQQQQQQQQHQQQQSHQYYCNEPVTPKNNNNPYQQQNYKIRKGGLMCELDMNAGLDVSPIGMTKIKPIRKIMPFNDLSYYQNEENFSYDCSGDDEYDVASSSPSTFKPKKKWLNGCMDAWTDDLAKPLDEEFPSQLKQQQQQQLPISTNVPLNSKVDNILHDYLENDVGGNLSFNDGGANVPVVVTPERNPNELRPTVLMVANKNSAVRFIESPPIIKKNNNQNIDISSNSINNSNYVSETIDNLVANFVEDSEALSSYPNNTVPLFESSKWEEKHSCIVESLHDASFRYNMSSLNEKNQFTETSDEQLWSSIANL